MTNLLATLSNWLTVATPMFAASITIDTEQYGWSAVFIFISFAGFALIRWQEKLYWKEFPNDDQ
jgi:hypothetical protein